MNNINTTMSNLIGKRVRLIRMVDEKQPVESGTIGTIRHVGGGVINVNWDNGRSLGLIEGEDDYEILYDELPKDNEVVFSGNY